MPALPNVPNTIRADLLWNVGSDVSALTRLHYAYSGVAPLAADCIYFATQIDSVAAGQFAGLLHPANSIRGCIVRDLSSSTANQGEFDATTPGTRGGSPLSAGTAVLMNFGIAQRYRGGKPRAYLPFGTSGDLTTPSLWVSSFVTAIQTAWTNFQTATIGLTHGGCTLTDMRAVSYYSGFTNVPYGSPTKYRRVPNLRGGGPVGYPFLSHNVSPKPSSQRRRNLQRR